MINQKKIIIGLIAVWIAVPILADAYNDRLVRIIQHIANEYDAQPNFMDPENMTSAALQAINFITIENNLSKNSPLGKKNKYITQHAESLKKIVITLLQLIQEAETIQGNKAKRDSVLKKLWAIEMDIKQAEGEIADIKKKQLLPLSSVQKDLINLLALLATKNLKIAQRMIRNVEVL